MIRILVLASEPKDKDPLRLEDEIRRIRDASRCRGLEELDFVPIQGAQFDDLVTELIQRDFNVVHFAGHEGHMEGDAHQSASVSNNTLVEAFRVMAARRRIDLVLFNVCRSAELADEVKSYVGCSIGYPHDIANGLAIIYTDRFYSALAAGWSIHEAHAIARLPLMHAGLSEADLPVLFERSPGISIGACFDPTPTACPQELASITIKINLAADNYNRGARQFIRDHLAAFLRISAEEIDIIRPQPTDHGTALIVTLRVPRTQLSQLTEAVDEGTPGLTERLKPIVIHRVDLGERVAAESRNWLLQDQMKWSHLVHLLLYIEMIHNAFQCLSSGNIPELVDYFDRFVQEPQIPKRGTDFYARWETYVTRRREVFADELQKYFSSASPPVVEKVEALREGASPVAQDGLLKVRDLLNEIATTLTELEQVEAKMTGMIRNNGGLDKPAAKLSDALTLAPDFSSAFNRLIGSVGALATYSDRALKVLVEKVLITQ